MRLNSIIEVLMERDGMSLEAANEAFDIAREDLNAILNDGNGDVYDGYEQAEAILADHFGLEPDYLFDLLEG
ncbi:MAG TPA: hypothetical protein PLA71_00795 [Saccharofermentans sp.]|nr:hypothetical protein [Saccharofermentans sp.]